MKDDVPAEEKECPSDKQQVSKKVRNKELRLMDILFVINFKLIPEDRK